VTERRLGALLSRGTIVATLLIALGALLHALVGATAGTAVIIAGSASFAALPIAGLLLVARESRRAGELRQFAPAALVIAIVMIDVVVGGLT
jgi:hypothetical protein